jgi:signal transduction histidine kinase
MQASPDKLSTMTSLPADPPAAETSQAGERQIIDEASHLIQELLTERRRVEHMQQEFLSVISHELRTPLAAMLGALGLLRSPRLAAEPQRMRELLEIAERNGDRLSRLINDLLDLQRLEAGTLFFHYSPAPVGELLDTAAQEVRELAGLHNVQVVVETAAATAILVTDRDRISQVLHKLLTNAVKFSPAGGEVVLQARVCGSTIELTVRDRGPGIPGSFKGRLYENFSQAEPASVRHHGGVGLGLSISKKIVEGLGGTITIASTPGAGTTVAVLLPQRTV